MCKRHIWASALIAAVLCFIPIKKSNACDGSEPLIASMCPFAGNFAPRGYALANGQLLTVSQNDALFSLLGTIYGGNGRTTFGLPDLRGRAAIHAGTGPGLSTYRLGAKGGAENVTLIVAQLPSHTHTASTSLSVSFDNDAIELASSATLSGVASVGNVATPGGNALGQLSGRRARAYSSSAPDVTLADEATDVEVTVTDPSVIPTTTLTFSGGSQSHYNVQPFIVVNWIIALQGIYPSRT